MSSNFYPYVQGWRVGNAPSSNDQPSVFGAFSRTSGNATAARYRQRYLIVTDAPQHPQCTVYCDNHRRTVALIDDRRTAQRGDARACCRGGPCEAGCTGPDRHGANDSLPRQHRPICFWHLLTPSQSSRSRIMGISCIWHIRVPDGEYICVCSTLSVLAYTVGLMEYLA